MYIAEKARQLINEELEGVTDIESQNWNQLKWSIVAKVLKALKGYDGWIDEFAVSNIYDNAFAFFLKA